MPFALSVLFRIKGILNVLMLLLIVEDVKLNFVQYVLLK